MLPFCLDKVFITCLLFSDNVSRSARKIEEAEKLQTSFRSRSMPLQASLLGYAQVVIGTSLLVRDTLPGSNPTGVSGMAPGLPHECFTFVRMWNLETLRAGAAAAGSPGTLTVKCMFCSWQATLLTARIA